MDCKNSLHTFVHRTLIYRLIAVGLSLSLLVGLTVLFIERGRVSREAIDFAVGRLSVFSNRYDHLLADPNNLEPEKIQQAVKEFRSARSYNKLGSFVFVGVYDAQGKVITEIFDQQQESLGELKKKQQKMKIKIPGDGNERYEIIRVAGLPFLRIALPLVNGNR
ncbi:MAG: hypothetical protein U9N63_00920, partial [Pseudomonadota bacterium]|nr:hypothetical protein [Pseudomonadota bacterium]